MNTQGQHPVTDVDPNPVKLVAFDLDGTILDAGESIAPECVAAIRQAHEAGIRCVIDSGRSIDFAADLLERIGLLDCFDALIGDERWIGLVQPDPDLPTARRVVGLSSWNDEVESRWERLEPQATEWCARVERQARELGWTPQPIGRTDALRRGLSAIWFDVDQQAQELLAWLLPRLAGTGLAANSNGGYIHVYDERCDKGSALLRVAEHFAIAARQVVAFGDNINDQPMLDGRYGFGAVAVANAKPAVKDWVRAAGGRVADRPSGLGVADELQPMTTPSPSWSCDSFVVLPDAAAARRLIFGKNSDRPQRECQPLRRVAARHGGGKLRLAYLEIPDADHTYDHLGSAPYWCWGHEIAMNSRGVVIGNEALFTRDLAATAAADRRALSDRTERPAPGLLGMELLRLGVERGGTAAQAVEVITGLLERYGQWGAGTAGRDRASAGYDNAYAIADPDEAYVLETSGRDWAVRRVTSGTASISNEPTIRTDWTALSAGLDARARENNWPGTGPRLDVAEAITDPGTPLQLSHIRLQRSRQLLDSAAATTGVDWAAARAVLTDHYEQTFLAGPAFNAARPDFLTLCMHASPAGFTWGNTAASVIAVPGAQRPYWWWAATTPCTSIYLPVAVTGAQLPAGLGQPGTAAGSGPCPESARPDEPADDSYWWTFQLLLEAVCGDQDGVCYPQRQPRVRQVLDPLQAEFLTAADALDRAGASPSAWDDLTRDCAGAARSAATGLLAEFGRD